MHVTSHVIGGFVVIDANASDEKKVCHNAPSAYLTNNRVLKCDVTEYLFLAFRKFDFHF